MRLISFFLAMGLTAINSANATDQTPPSAPNLNSNTANVQAMVEIEDLQNQIKKMRGDMEKIQFELANMNEKLVKFSADIEFRFNQLEGKQNKKISDEIVDNFDEKLDEKYFSDKSEAEIKKQRKGNSDKQGNNEDEKTQKQAYKDAYQLIKDNKFTDAKTAFKEYLNKYPTGSLAANAYFWIGEVQLQDGQADEAAVNYLKGYQVNPRGPRASDNLYKLSKSLAKLGKRKEACITLNKLKKEFHDLSGTVKKQLDEDFITNRCE